MALAHQSRKRVLLVGDDASLGALVSAALKESAFELIICRTSAEARRSVRQLAPALVLLDLMLPDASAMQLLQDAQLRRITTDTPWVLLAADVKPAMRAQLQALGVRQVLVKPVSRVSLLECVNAALAPARAPVAPPSNPGAPSTHPVFGAALDGSAEAEAAAIRDYFESDRQLFEMMKARAIAQFPHDVRAGEAAMAGADGAALRRLAHSLKTVLRMLGHPAAADVALSLERAAETGDRMTWPSLWQALRKILLRLGAEAGGPR